MDIHQLAQQLRMNDEDIREFLAALAIEAYNEFTQSGNREQLDKAVQIAKGSVDTKDGSILTSIDRLNNLGVMLEGRYERTGEMAIGADHTSDDLARIWWIGTGLGSSMPFHAAGVHSPGSTENAFSRAVSSYTPSIKTLGYAHRRARMTESAQVSLLIATMPTTPADAFPPDAGKPCDLPGVMKEEKHVKELVVGNIPVQSLNSPSVAQVIDKMRDCSIAHFACHGSTDHADPSNSGLILQRQDDQGLKQDRLTVRQVSELNLAGARIAYLSACSTAENKAARLSDEMIHVVSGFQVAGFPHVVGCLWPSIDRICVEVAGGFYQSLFRRRRDATCWGGQAVACAVREAVMAVREADMDAPLVWAQFVHFGA